MYEQNGSTTNRSARAATLLLDENDKAGTANFDGRIKTEITIIQSETVAIRVIIALQLYANPSFVGEDRVREAVKGLDALSC